MDSPSARQVVEKEIVTKKAELEAELAQLQQDQLSAQKFYERENEFGWDVIKEYLGEKGLNARWFLKNYAYDQESKSD